MYRIDDATAATSLPTPEAALAEGYFTEGNPGTGTPATKVRASWLNMLQEELRAVVVGAGLTPSKTAYSQVYAAIQLLIKGAAQGISSTSNISTTAKINGVNAANLLFNGSGEFGNAGWLASNFASTSGGFGEGTIFLNGLAITSGASLYDQANNFACGAGVALTLSGEISAGGLTAGFAAIGADFLDASLNNIGGILSPNIGPGAPRQFVSVSGTTPASTAFVRVYKMCGSNPRSSAFGVSFRRIKVEQGTTPSLYSQEATIATAAGGMPVVGSARNIAMGVATASATATLTADEIIVCSALGGVAYKLANFNKTINLATTGAGGMDTGSAPVSGFVALYAIYNPTTGASALLARNATSAVQPNVYGGGSMPAGYTASALVSVWQTTSGGLFNVGSQFDRVVSTPGFTVLSTTTQAGSYTSFSISGGVPPNAKTARGYQSITGNTASAGLSSSIAGSASGIGAAGQAATMPTNSASVTAPFPHVPLVTSQTLYYLAAASSGTLTFVVGVYEYTF
ncbi:hypothetical protein [Burkholderia cepacia]|uniref:hypothetical protein n=1 Tax=Burkholderia cepacia TaxID=292 RepID=UPI001CF539DA|nr:hypothetical protein [Burkholderia cepacia]MCA8026469.1 hypothetical protein [Burkholderia cepacia]